MRLCSLNRMFVFVTSRFQCNTVKNVNFFLYFLVLRYWENILMLVWGWKRNFLTVLLNNLIKLKEPITKHLKTSRPQWLFPEVMIWWPQTNLRSCHDGLRRINLLMNENLILLCWFVILTCSNLLQTTGFIWALRLTTQTQIMLIV